LVSIRLVPAGRGTYWRQDAGNRRFDAQIAEEYSDLVAADARPGSIRARPLGRALPGVLEQLKSGAPLEAIGQWVFTLSTAECTSSDAGLQCWVADLRPHTDVRTLFHWLSAGRPVLAPNLGTIPAYVVDGWNGWLYVNADDLRARLACAMSASVEEETGLADNARKTAGTLRWGMWEGE